MKKIIYLSFLFILLYGSSCTKSSDKCHKTIAFVNNSSKDIYIHGGNYPDTLHFNKLFPNPTLNAHMYKVKSGEKNTAGVMRRSCFEGSIERGEIIVYVFDAEILETVPWDTVGKYYMVLKTILPTLDEMQNSNWTIIYPPSPNMSAVKMYPPYGQ